MPVETQTDDLQSLYDEMNRRGMFESDPDLQAIGHEMRARKLITDPTQGGIMTNQAGVDAAVNKLLGPAPAAPAAQQSPAQDIAASFMGGMVGGMVGPAAQAFGPSAPPAPPAPPPYLASPDNPHDQVTNDFANRFLRGDNRSGVTYGWFERAVGVPVQDRPAFLAKSRLSAGGQLAILREAYRVSPHGRFRSIESQAADAGIPLAFGTTPRGKKGVVAVRPEDVDKFRKTFFNTEDPKKRSIPLQVAHGLAKDPTNKALIARVYRMSPPAQAAILQKSGEIVEQNATKMRPGVDVPGGAFSPPSFQGPSGDYKVYQPVESATSAVMGPEGYRQFQEDQGVGATFAKTGLGFIEPESLGLLGLAGGAPKVAGLLKPALEPVVSRFISTVFAADMGHGAYEQFSQGNDAAGTVNAIMGGLAGLHAAKGHGKGAVSKANAARAAISIQELMGRYADTSRDSPSFARNIEMLRQAQEVAARVAQTGETPEAAAAAVIRDSRSGLGAMAAPLEALGGSDRRASSQPAAPPASRYQGQGTVLGGAEESPVILGPNGLPYRTAPPVASEVKAAPPAAGPAPVTEVAPLQPAAAPVGRVELDTDMFGNEHKTQAGMQKAADDYNKAFPGINARIERVGKRNVLVADQHPVDYAQERQNAIQEQGSAEVYERQQGQAGGAGSGPGRVEPILQGQETPGARPIEAQPQAQNEAGQARPAEVARPAETFDTRGMVPEQHNAAAGYFLATDRHFGKTLPEGGHLKVLSDLLQRPIEKMGDVTPEEWRAAAELVPWHDTITGLMKQRELMRSRTADLAPDAMQQAQKFGYGREVRKLASEVFTDPKDHLEFKKIEEQLNEQTFNLVDDLREATQQVVPVKGYDPFGRTFSTGEPATRATAREWLRIYYGKEIPASELWDRYREAAGFIHGENLAAQIHTLTEILKRRPPPDEPPPAAGGPEGAVPPPPTPPAPPVPSSAVAAKEPWQMTGQEYRADQQANREASIRRWNVTGSKGLPPGLGVDTIQSRNALAERAGYVLPRDAKAVTAMPFHRLIVEAALREGKPVPPEVLKDYPDLAPPAPESPAALTPSERHGETNKYLNLLKDKAKRDQGWAYLAWLKNNGVGKEPYVNPEIKAQIDSRLGDDPFGVVQSKPVVRTTEQGEAPAAAPTKTPEKLAIDGLWAALGKQGMGDLPRHQRLAMVSQIVGRKINSFKELLPREAQGAARVISEGGAPKPEDVSNRHVRGHAGVTYTPDNNPVGFHYAVVEGAELVPSHTSMMKENPRYDQSLQPRDRTRRASTEQVFEIASKLTPERLAGAPSTAEGAPLIGRDNQVESGNGRALGILRAYEKEPHNARRYQQWIVENAEGFGLDPLAIGKMKQPVLVRVRETFRGKADLTPAERAAFADEAGKSTVAEMSAEERAAADGKRVRQSGMLGMFRLNDEGSVQTSANQPFVNRFIQELSPGERGKMRQADGSLSAEGAERIQNAVTAAAFDDPKALRRLLGDPDPEAKNVGRAMIQAAPRLALLKEAMAKGDIPNVDITGDIVRAADRYAGLRERNESIPDYLAQQNLFGNDPIEHALIRWFYENKRSTPAVRELFDAYADVASGTLSEPLTKMQTLEAAIGVAEGRLGRDTQTGDLFGGPDESGSAVAEGPAGYSASPGEAARPDRVSERPRSNRADADRPGQGSEPPTLSERLQSEIDSQSAKLRSDLRGGLFTGGESVILARAAYIGALHLAKGVVKFGEWSRRMIADLGEAIEPHLIGIWDAAQDLAGSRSAMAAAKKQFGEPSPVAAESGAPTPPLPSIFGPDGSLDPAAMRARLMATGRDVAGRMPSAEEADPNRLTVFDQVNHLRRAGLLTSPRTINKVLVSHGIFLAAEELARVPASVADAILGTFTGKRTVYAPRPAEVMKATILAATQGVKEAALIMRHGESAMVRTDRMQNMTRFSADLMEESPTKSKIANAYINLVSRMHGAAYRPFKVYAWERAVQEMKRLAPGLSEEAIQAQAIEAAEVATFLNKNKASSALNAAKDELGPFGRGVIDFLMPIQRVPVNIVARMLEYGGGVPFSVARAIATKVVNKSFDVNAQRDFSRTFGRGSIGLGIIYIGAKLAEEGLATSYPRDWKERESGKAEGRPMAAIKVDGRWYEVQTINPIGSLFAVGASLAHIGPGHAAWESLHELPYMHTINDLAEAGTERGAKYMAGSALGSFVPTVLSDVAAQMDTNERRRRSPLDYMRARIPGLRDDLEMKPAKETNKLFDPFNSR